MPADLDYSPQKMNRAVSSFSLFSAGKRYQIVIYPLSFSAVRISILIQQDNILLVTSTDIPITCCWRRR